MDNTRVNSREISNPEMTVSNIEVTVPNGCFSNCSFDRSKCTRTVKLIDPKMIAYKQFQKDTEKHTKAMVKKDMDERLEKYKQFKNKQNEKYIESIKEIDKILKNIKKETDDVVINATIEHNNEMRQLEESQKQLSYNREQLLIENRKKFEQELKEKNMLDQIFQFQVKFRVCYETILGDRQFYEKHKNEFAQLVGRFDQIFTNVKSGKRLAVKDVESAQNTFCEMDHFKHEMEMEQSNRIIEEQNRQQRQLQEEAELQERQKIEYEKLLSEKKQSADVVDATQIVVNLKNQNIYEQSVVYFNELTQQILPITNGNEFQKYKFNCQKAINSPINVISNTSSPQFMIEQFTQLDSLLCGKPVFVNNQNFSADEHPTGRLYCCFLMAKKLGEKTDDVSVTFHIASIIKSLWQKYSEFGKMFLMHIYVKCPYLIPYYLPQFEGQSSEEYYKALGYKYSNGVVEAQDLYLSRLSKIGRLYFATMIVKPRRNELTSDPFNIDQGWKWIAETLNLENMSDISAILILDFLETCGFAMFHAYRNHFEFILANVHRLNSIKENKEGGPSNRLEIFFKKYLVDRKIKPPKGYFANYW